MKHTILLIIIIASIAFLGCDGKERVHLSNVEVLKAHKLLDSFTEKVEFIPKQYSEVITDTLLSNGFKVKIKTYTDMESTVLQTAKVDSIINKHYFRDVIFEIEVFKNEKKIFDKKIRKEFFSNNKDYVNNEIYIDEIKTLETNTLYLIASQCIPRTVNCPLYSLIIDKKGTYTIIKID